MEDDETDDDSNEPCLSPQDGSVQLEIKLTGQVSTNYALPGEEEPALGTTMLENVVATHHQHIFAARLDMAVDDPAGGKDLQISEVTMYYIHKDSQQRRGCVPLCIIGPDWVLPVHSRRQSSSEVLLCQPPFGIPPPPFCCHPCLHCSAALVLSILVFLLMQQMWPVVSSHFTRHGPIRL